MVLDKYVFFNLLCTDIGYVKFMIFNATFNNISVISWRSVLLVEETGVPRENHVLTYYAAYFKYITLIFVR